jgi:hypothetical protein
MPAQERLRSHREGLPALSRQHPAQRREKQPVVELEPRLFRLPAKNRQLVPKHKNLQLFRPLATPEQHDQLQQAADDDVQG